MMRRSPFRPKVKSRSVALDRSEEFASVLVAPVQARMAARVDLERRQPVEKEAYFYSEAWRRAVASLPCVLCGRHGSTQCAHRNEGKAGGKKLMDDCWTAALCTACHSGIDQGGDYGREERRSTMDLAILLTVRELARRGMLRIAA